MKTIKLLLLVVVATLFCNCATSNLKGLHSSNNHFKQHEIKSNSVNSMGLYVSNQPVRHQDY